MICVAVGNVSSTILVALAGLGAVAAAGDNERQRAFGVGEAEMQSREPAHRNANDMRLHDFEPVEQAANVLARPLLRVSFLTLGNVRRWVTASVVGDAAVAPREKAQLRLVAVEVAGEFMDEHDRRASTGFLIIEFDAIVGDDLRHGPSPVLVLPAS